MEQIILFIFLILFPFGQIIRIGILQPLDVVAAVGTVWAIYKHYKKPGVFKYLDIFLITAAFSWILSIFIFGRTEVLYGVLYLIRLFAYSYFFLFVWNFVKRSNKNKELLYNSLLSVSIISAVFGWVQYFIYPDTRPLFALGWDDHLYRLIGTFLDPAFLGLIIVFGLLIAIYRYFLGRKARYIIISAFLVLSIAYTYSRASYLAFFAGLFVILYFFKKLKYFLLAAGAFLILMFLLPIRDNTILFFTRSFSAINRLQNYGETVQIIKSSPLFGVGYDNLCLARAGEVGYINYASHSCSGSDSSILFILATTGVIGFTAFIQMAWRFWKESTRSQNFVVVAASFVALLVHSLFSNSIFYPWIMGYFFILLALSLRSEV